MSKSVKPRESDPVDFLAPIRRAILLRSIAKGARPNLFDGENFNIDRPLLRALLNTKNLRLKHGARSLESVITMSSLSDTREFSQSNLPPDHMLNMHIQAEELHALIAGYEETV